MSEPKLTKDDIIEQIIENGWHHNKTMPWEEVFSIICEVDYSDFLADQIYKNLKSKTKTELLAICEKINVVLKEIPLEEEAEA